MKKNERKAIPTHLASLPKMNNCYNCGISFPLKKCFIYVQTRKHTTCTSFYTFIFLKVPLGYFFLSRVLYCHYF